jgi:putative transposase
LSAPRPDIPGRRSIRRDDWDYTSPGAYFVTMVADQRECLFAEIVDGEIRLTEAGCIAREEWFQTASLRANVVLQADEFVVMPNHVHGILWIIEPETPSPLVEGSLVWAQQRCAPTMNDLTTNGQTDDARCAQTMNNLTTNGARTEKPHVIPSSLGAILRAYKSAVTRRINAQRGCLSLPVWQRNYYEKIIRSPAELDAARSYIRNNPLQWELDAENTTHLEARP